MSVPPCYGKWFGNLLHATFTDLSASLAVNRHKQHVTRVGTEIITDNSNTLSTEGVAERWVDGHDNGLARNCSGQTGYERVMGHQQGSFGKRRECFREQIQERERY